MPYAIIKKAFQTSCYTAICSIGLPLNAQKTHAAKNFFLIYGLFIHLICTQARSIVDYIDICMRWLSTHNLTNHIISSSIDFGTHLR